MSQFTTQLKVKQIDENLWELEEGFEYHVGYLGSDDRVMAPTGFHTDFASVPKIFWKILPPNGKYGKAAVIHDYCYYTGCYSKWKSDKVFLECMKVLKVKKWKRQTMFWAVVLFGAYAWYKHRWREKKERRSG
jgi:hypothetical protein